MYHSILDESFAVYRHIVPHVATGVTLYMERMPVIMPYFARYTRLHPALVAYSSSRRSACRACDDAANDVWSHAEPMTFTLRRRLRSDQRGLAFVVTAENFRRTHHSQLDQMGEFIVVTLTTTGPVALRPAGIKDVYGIQR